MGLLDPLRGEFINVEQVPPGVSMRIRIHAKPRQIQSKAKD